MPLNNDAPLYTFTEEEEILFSNLRTLRKSDNAHFRREFKALGDNQARFLEYLDDRERTKPPTKEKPLILNGFILSRQSDEPMAPPLKKDRRRCTLL